MKNYDIPLTISAFALLIGLLFIIFSMPEEFAGLPYLSWQPPGIELEQITSAKEILKQCDLPEDDYNRIADSLFEAEKEHTINDNPVEAGKHYRYVIGDLIKCKRIAEGKPSFLDTNEGIISIIIEASLGVILVIFAIKNYQLKKKKDDYHLRKNKKKLKMGRIFLLKNIYFILLPIVFLASYVISNFIEVDSTILPVIVTASSFIVAILAGFLINSYYNIKQIRLEKLNRFAELQNRLRDYCNAFYWFVDALERKYNKLDYKFPTPLKDLERDSKWLYENDESVAILFVRRLREFAGLPNDIPDFELSNSIIKKERLDDMYEYISSAGSLLARYKHFKYILKEFNLKDTQYLDEVIIIDSPFVKNGARKITKINENYKTLGFWEEKISECMDILSRMKTVGKFVYSFKPFELNRLGLNLLFISSFGILIPVVTLMLGANITNFQSILSIISTIGFVIYFILGILRIYLKLSSHQLSYT